MATTSRLINYIVFGNSSSDRGTRNINSSSFNFQGGETWYDALGKARVAGPLASGCTSLWLHNYAGVGGRSGITFPYDKDDQWVVRYNKNQSPGSNKIISAMHFEQMHEALSVDPALFGLNTTGIASNFIVAVSSWVASGNGSRRVFTYQGRPAGDRKAADVLFTGYMEGSQYYNLDYLTSGVRHALGGFVFGMAFDATGSDETPNDGSTHNDPINIPYGDVMATFLASGLYNSGIHTAPLGYSGGPFVNPRRVRVYSEAIPRTGGFTNWWRNYSACGNYWNLDNANAGVTEFHDDQFAYPPVYLVIRKEDPNDTGDPDLDDFLDTQYLYNRAAGYLASGKWVACNLSKMAGHGLDINYLITLGTDPDVTDVVVTTYDSLSLTLSENVSLGISSGFYLTTSDTLAMTIAENSLAYDSTPTEFDINRIDLSGRTETNGLASIFSTSVSFSGTACSLTLRGSV